MRCLSFSDDFTVHDSFVRTELHKGGTTQRWLFLCCLIGLSASLSACAGTGQRARYLHGPLTSLSDFENIAPSDAAAETAVLEAFRQHAGLAGEKLPAEADARWQLIVWAGLNAIDEQCEKYIDAIFWAYRDLRTVGNQINLAGATTSAILGAVGASAAAIATTAASLGFATQGITNIANGLFYKIEPSGIRKIVKRGQVAYRQGVEQRITTYDSRPKAVAAIQGYLSLCLPASIETQINEAVAARDFKVDDKNTGPVPNLTGVPTVQTPAATIETIGKDIKDLEKTITERGAGAAVVNPGPPASDRIASPIGDYEKKIPKEMGRRIQAGLCLVPDKDPVTFGPRTREAIVLFRQTSAANNLPGARRSGGLSAGEASYLANHKCDRSCSRNAYEYYRFGLDSPNKQSNLQDLAAKLKNAAPSLEMPKDPQNLCDLRPAISAVQKTEAYSRWKASNGTLDFEFVNQLPPPFRPGD
jgi:hypothetical protein